MSNLSHRISVLAIALAVVSFAAMSGPKPEVNSQPGSPVQAVATTNAASEFVYFPSQYVNQAREPSPHIQAF